MQAASYIPAEQQKQLAVSAGSAVANQAMNQVANDYEEQAKTQQDHNEAPPPPPFKAKWRRWWCFVVILLRFGLFFVIIRHLIHRLVRHRRSRRYCKLLLLICWNVGSRCHGHIHINLSRCGRSSIVVSIVITVYIGWNGWRTSIGSLLDGWIVKGIVVHRV